MGVEMWRIMRGSKHWPVQLGNTVELVELRGVGINNETYILTTSVLAEYQHEEIEQMELHFNFFLQSL